MLVWRGLFFAVARCASKFLFSSFTAELDAILLIDRNDFHLNFVANAADVRDAAHVFVRQFTNVTEAIASRKNFDKRAEILNAAYGALVDLADLYRSGYRLDLSKCFVSIFRIVACDRDHTFIVHFDHSAGRFLKRANVFSTRSDEHPDFFGIDLRAEKSWRPA